MPCDMSPAPKKSNDAPPEAPPRNGIPEDNVEGPHEVIMNVNLDSDSDASENETAPPNDPQLENDGYQLLSTDPNGPVDHEQQAISAWNDGASNQFMETSGREDEDFSTPRDPALVIPHQPRLESLPLDAEKVEDIKSRMATFVLPPCQHPPWALDVAEDDWKMHLLERIRTRSVDEPKKE